MFISDEENQILSFLQQSPDAYFSGHEICRKAGTKKTIAANPRWALTLLVSLADKHLIERDAQGHVRLVVDRRPKE